MRTPLPAARWCCGRRVAAGLSSFRPIRKSRSASARISWQPRMIGKLCAPGFVLFATYAGRDRCRPSWSARSPRARTQRPTPRLRLIFARPITVHHPLGTCKMGVASDPMAVVDAELRVHGIEGLRIVDGSVMPDLVGANINAPIIMIAEKAADLIRGRQLLEPARMAAVEHARQ